MAPTKQAQKAEPEDEKDTEVLAGEDALPPAPKGPVFDKADREWIASCAEKLMIARVAHSGSREIPSGEPTVTNTARMTVGLAVALRKAMLEQTAQGYEPKPL